MTTETPLLLTPIAGSLPPDVYAESRHFTATVTRLNRFSPFPSVYVKDPDPSGDGLGPCNVLPITAARSAGFSGVLPPVMRVQSLTRLRQGDTILNGATLYHRQATRDVEWITNRIDPRLYRNALVSIRSVAGTQDAEEGTLRIERLVPVTSPVCGNLFDTVPPGWVGDPDLVARAAGLWHTLPSTLGYLVNAVLGEGGRLVRFVTSPSSIDGAYAERGGIFRHSIEVAERARDLGRGFARADVSLLVAGGLLHDAAKAFDYRYDRRGQRFCSSRCAERAAPHATLIDWLSIARETSGVVIDDATWQGLLQVFAGTDGTPPWFRSRQALSVEAELLSIADCACVHEELQRRDAEVEGGP